MANVLNRATLEYLTSVNTPDFPPAQFVINPDLSAVQGFPSKYWILTGNAVTLQNAAQRQVTDDNEFRNNNPVLPFDFGEFGDGSDGDVTVSINTSLSRDAYYGTLIVNAGIILNTNGFRIFAKTNVACLGTIAAIGNAAAGSVAGAGAASGSIGGGGNGASGAAGNGVAATNVTTNETPGYGGGGGAGGTGNGGATTSGAGGLVLSDTQIRTKPRRYDSISSGSEADLASSTRRAFYQGGAGGGSGGGPNGAAAGGGGGGGGGVIIIVTPRLFIDTTGIITANGGAGASAGSNTGGGGGGGGGLVLVTADRMLNRGALTVAGGAGAATSGTGQAGQTGQAGRFIGINIG
jgi:hypothetical protein